MTPQQPIGYIESFCQKAKGRFTLPEILDAVCVSLHITRAQIRMEDRIGWCADARRIFCYVSRKLTDDKWEVIGYQIERYSADAAFKAADTAECKLKAGKELFTEKTILVIEHLKSKL